MPDRPRVAYVRPTSGPDTANVRRAGTLVERAAAGRTRLFDVEVGGLVQMADRDVTGGVARGELGAVLFDVDFTLAKPGPDLGPDGYRRLGARFGLTLEPTRYAEARLRALEHLERHPELEHDDEVWIAFTERIIRFMGGDADGAYDCAVEMTLAWERSENFELYEDAIPVLADLRERGLKLGLVSNTGRDLDAFIEHHHLVVDAALASRAHGKTKPDPSIFRAVLDLLGFEPAAAAMVGDSVEDDIEGARALGMHAVLLDRESRFPEFEPRIDDLRALPAALGLP